MEVPFGIEQYKAMVEAQREIINILSQKVADLERLLSGTNPNRCRAEYPK